MKNILKNWKTTLSGVLIAGLAFVNYKGFITTDELLLITSLLTSLGLIVAKDGDKTGVSSKDSEIWGDRPNDR